MPGFEDVAKMMEESIADSAETNVESVEETKEDVKTEDTETKVEDTDTETDEKTPSEDGIDIDEHIYNTAVEAGMTEEEIFEAYEKYPKLLDSLVPQAKKEDIPEDEKQEDLETPEFTKFELSKEDAEALEKTEGGKVILGVLENLNKQVQDYEEKQAQHKAKEEEVQNAKNVDLANRKMDEWSKDLPELGVVSKFKKNKDGKYDTNTSEYKLREKLYNVAQMFQVNGMAATIEEGLDQAKNWYVGSNPKAIERRLVDDINARKKRFVARPTNKKQKVSKHNPEDMLMKGIENFINR